MLPSDTEQTVNSGSEAGSTTAGNEGISRRRMLQAVGLSTLGVGAALYGASKHGSETSNGKFSLRVYDPSGQVIIRQSFAPRLESLEGKTIGFVGVDYWQDAASFLLVRHYLEDVYHCTVYDQSHFLNGTENITRDDNGIAEQMLSLGVDAAILGNAG